MWAENLEEAKQAIPTVAELQWLLSSCVSHVLYKWPVQSWGEAGRFMLLNGQGSVGLSGMRQAWSQHGPGVAYA